MAACRRDDSTYWSTSLPPEPTSVRAARHFAADVVRELGRDCDVEHATLLVSELATNAVLHARTPMRLSVWDHDGHVRCELRDDLPSLGARDDGDALATGGRGLHLVESMATAWGVNGNERGKTIWFEL